MLLFCCLSFCLFACFTRDVRKPLSQIRLSLSVSLGAGQIIFLAGIKATENTVSDFFIHLRYICSSGAKVILKKGGLKQTKTRLSFLSHRLSVLRQQLSRNISWWPLSVGWWSREFIFICLLWKFITLATRCTRITSSHGVLSFHLWVFCTCLFWIASVILRVILYWPPPISV